MVRRGRHQPTVGTIAVEVLRWLRESRKTSIHSNEIVNNFNVGELQAKAVIRRLRKQGLLSGKKEVGDFNYYYLTDEGRGA